MDTHSFNLSTLIGTWYSRGFEDPSENGTANNELSDPTQFAEIQDHLAWQFEAKQAELGDPIKFPDELDVQCAKR